MQHISLVSSAVQNIVINMTFSVAKADTFHYIMNYFFIMKYKRCIKVLKCLECRGCLTPCVFFILSSRREFRLTLIDKRIKLRQKCEFIFLFL